MRGELSALDDALKLGLAVDPERRSGGAISVHCDEAVIMSPRQALLSSPRGLWTTHAAPVDQGRLGFPTVAHRPHAQDGVVLTVEEASRRLQPSLRGSQRRDRPGERVRPVLAQLRELAGRHRLALGGYVQVSLGTKPALCPRATSVCYEPDP